MQVQVIFVRLQVIVQVQRRCRGGAQGDGAEEQIQMVQDGAEVMVQSRCRANVVWRLC